MSWSDGVKVAVYLSERLVRKGPTVRVQRRALTDFNASLSGSKQ